ncbi:putative retrotransposon hot spot (RHS) protein [Trypanosoma cruzi]|nr:putative retrotransposon hot spot (RHS) protein [Trypanosoma cruzi]
MTTYRCANLTLRPPAAFLQNENTRSPDANSSWRQSAPNSTNERHALSQERRSDPRGRRRRRAGKKPRHSERPDRWTRHAAKHGRRWRYRTAASHASLDGGLCAVTHGPTEPGRKKTAPDVSGQFWWPHFHPLLPLPSRTSLLDANSATEKEEPHFCAFDVTTWPPRIWDEGVSGDFFDTLDAYDYW